MGQIKEYKSISEIKAKTLSILCRMYCLQGFNKDCFDASTHTLNQQLSNE